MTPRGTKARRAARLPLSRSWKAEVFFSLLKDHKLLATDPPLFRIYIIPTRLQATTKLEMVEGDIKKTGKWSLGV